jgi:SPP1 gp7 family putative phage head morphogenesis protein
VTQINLHPDIARQLTDRTVVTKDKFLQMGDEARMRAFTIAKQTEAQVLQQTLDAIKETVAQGGTLRDFKENFPELLAPYREAGRERHLDLVFNQNVKQAQAVGAYQARQETKSLLPYVEYQAGINPRPSHAALNGKIFPVDDPFLLAHTPPWEFGCNCDLISRTAKQVGRAREADQGRELEEQQVVPGNSKLESLAARNKMPMAERVGASGGALYPVDVRPPALKGGEYSFRPDRLNQPVDLSPYDPEIRDRLIQELRSVGYQVQGDQAIAPGQAASGSASKRVATAHKGRVGPAEVRQTPTDRLGRVSGRLGRPAPQIAPHAPHARISSPRKEAA